MNANKIEIGQEVVIVTVGNYGPRYSFGWKVAKVSPTGQTTLEKGDMKRRFGSNGRELGEKYYNITFSADVAGLKAAEDHAAALMRARDRWNSISVDRLGPHPSKEVLAQRVADMEAELAEVKALIAAVGGE